MASNPTGVSVSVWVDGVDSSNDCITTECDHIDTQWLCPYALGEVSPMREGDQCHRKADGTCRLLFARVDAMKRAINLLKREIKNIEEQMED